MRRPLFKFFGAVFLPLLAALPSQAQYPDRLIKAIVPFSTGGTNDIVLWKRYAYIVRSIFGIKLPLIEIGYGMPTLEVIDCRFRIPLCYLVRFAVMQIGRAHV